VGIGKRKNQEIETPLLFCALLASRSMLRHGGYGQMENQQMKTPRNAALS
jgi:hypothetical protein